MNGKVFSDTNINAIIEKGKVQGSLTAEQADYIMSNDFDDLPENLKGISKKLGLPQDLKDIAKTLGIKTQEPGIFKQIGDCCKRILRRAKCCVGCITCTAYCSTCCCVCNGCGNIPKAREMFFDMPLKAFLQCFTGEVIDQINAANPMGPNGVEMLKQLKEAQLADLKPEASQPSKIRRRLQNPRILEALKRQTETKYTVM